MRDLNRPPEAVPGQERLAALASREVEVLSLMACGLSNQGIAETLGKSERTVRLAVANILSKLGLENRTQAALYALTSGLVTLDEVESHLRSGR